VLDVTKLFNGAGDAI